jgi:GTP cyclohydrolase III
MILISIFSLIILTLIWTTYNLLHKVEKMEDAISNQTEFINGMLEHVDIINTTVTTLDTNGAFESDDEVGTFFIAIRSMRNKLVNYISTLK